MASRTYDWLNREWYECCLLEGAASGRNNRHAHKKGYQPHSSLSETNLILCAQVNIKPIDSSIEITWNGCVVKWRTLFWGVDTKFPLAPGRPTNGGVLQFRAVYVAHLVDSSVGRVAFFQVDSSRYRAWTWLGLGLLRVNLHTIAGVLARCSIWVTLISTRSPCPKTVLNFRAFWPLEPSRDLSPYAFTYFLRPIAVGFLNWESSIPGQAIQGYHLI